VGHERRSLRAFVSMLLSKELNEQKRTNKKEKKKEKKNNIIGLLFERKRKRQRDRRELFFQFPPTFRSLLKGWQKKRSMLPT
jgi:hypothetical protein